MYRLNALYNVLVLAFMADCQIFYPNTGSINDFHAGDSLTVELTSPYDTSSRLSLFCSNEENRRQHLAAMQTCTDQEPARFTSSVPARSTSPVTFRLPSPSENCYLELRQDTDNYKTSPIFSVGPSNGTSTTWSSGSQSDEEQSFLTSAMEQATATAQQPLPSTVRPDISLPDDVTEEQYVLEDGTKCLDISGTQSNSQGCWEKLQLSAWLPKWV
ncbi:MAG: hypothetical protein Q9180_003569 [Flavoplaca navasiana]